MKRSIAILLVAAICSSARAQPIPSAHEALRDSLQAVRSMKCEAELGCWKRLVLRLDMATEAAANTLEASEQRYVLALSELDLWKTQAGNSAKALAAMKPLLVEHERPWHQHPALWFALGFTVAAGATIGVLAASRRVEASIR